MSGFNATPLDGSTPAIPMSTAISPGDATPHTIMGGPTYTDSNGNILVPVMVAPQRSATGTPTSVAGNASAVALLTSNANRKGVYIYNDSSATLYLGFFAHTSLTTSVYTTQVPPGNLYEMPNGLVYTGEISGIWSSATGNARITEMS